MLRSLLLAALVVLVSAPASMAQAPTDDTWPSCLPKPLGAFAEYAFSTVLPVRLNEDGDEEIPYHFRLRALDSNGVTRLDTLISSFGEGTDKCTTLLSIADRPQGSGPNTISYVRSIYSADPAGRHLTWTFQELDAPSFSSPVLFSRSFTYNACVGGVGNGPWSFYCGSTPSFVPPAGGAKPEDVAVDEGDTMFHYDRSALHIVPVTVNDAFGPGKTYQGLDDLFASTGDAGRWLMPHGARTMCETLAADGFTCPQSTLRNYSLFLSASTGDPATPGQIHTPRLRDWTLTSGVTDLYDFYDDNAPNRWTWGLEGQTVYVPAGASIRAGTAPFDIDRMTITALDPAQGWGGIEFDGGEGVLTGAQISGVRIVAPPGGGGPFGGLTTVVPDGGALVARDAEIVLDSATVSGTVDGSGILAYGTSTVTIAESSLIQLNGRYGAKAVGDATIVLDGGEVNINDLGGVFASNARFRGFRGIVSNNTGAGVHADFDGEAEFVRALGGSGTSSFAGGTSTAGTVKVNGNLGGLYASTVSSVTSVVPVCVQAPCDPVNTHDFARNVPANSSGIFDASALYSSGVTSNEDFWGTNVTATCTANDGTTNPACQLTLRTDDSGVISIFPDPTASNAFAKGGTASTSASKNGGVAEGIIAAETAAARGDVAGALAATLAVLGDAFTDGEVSSAYGLAARLGKRHEMPALAALLATQSALPGHKRVHARAALGAIHAGAGRTQAARAAYRNAARDADGVLALRIQRALVALAVDADDLGGTIEAIGGFLAAEPTDEQVSEVAGLVLRAFPDASFADVRPAAPETGKTGDASTAQAALLSAPSPNPSAGVSEIAFALVEAGTVQLTVYDALGREVAVLADGDYAAGAHAAPFDGRTVAPGVYLVRLSAGDASATTRLTVVR